MSQKASTQTPSAVRFSSASSTTAWIDLYASGRPHIIGNCRRIGTKLGSAGNVGIWFLLVGVLYLKAHESEARGHILPFLSAQHKVGPSFDLSALLKGMYPEAVVDTVVYAREEVFPPPGFAAAAAGAAGAG